MQHPNNQKPVGKPRGRRRDRDCRSCKSRGVKCDLNRPSCGQCVANGVPCGGYLQRVVWVGRASSNDSAASASSAGRHSKSPSQGPGKSSLSLGHANGQIDTAPSDTSISWSEADENSCIKSLFTFCQQIISLNDNASTNNPYTSDEAVRLILSLLDFAQARIDHHPADRDASSNTGEAWESEAAARCRLNALTGLKETLAVTNPFALVGIAVFTFFDVCDSDFGDWQRHLFGAKSVLDYHCKDRTELDRIAQSVPGLQEMVSRLLWFDSCGTLVRGTSDLIFEDWHREIMSESFFRTVGCAADTFDLLTRVARGEVVSDPRNSSILATHQLLQLGQGSTDWDRCADAYRCAAVIAFISSLADDAAEFFQIARIPWLVDRTCRIVASMATTSRFYIHLALPAYMAGINAAVVQQCHVLRYYWHSCSRARIPRYASVLTRCEVRWKAMGLV